MDLPKGVHRVVSRGREYFYFQAHRGTPEAGPRLPLPKNPHDPEFWLSVRKAQGAPSTAPDVLTFDAVCDLYETSTHFAKLSSGTKEQYRKWLRIARQAWGRLAAEGLRPVHVRTLLDELGDRPGAANNVLGTLRALSSWGRERDHFPHSITDGVKPYKSAGGHKPWTARQLEIAAERFTGMVRRAFLLARYTGQRGSDVVRLGETFIDDGGFRIAQKKTGREIWCPIDDALAAEIATWDRSPGPYLRQDRGKLYGRKLLDKQFRDQVTEIPELAECTFHGLRSTRVVELRRLGLTSAQIQDQIGMSLAMIERYCRFADKKANGKASVVSLAERRKNARL